MLTIKYTLFIFIIWYSASKAGVETELLWKNLEDGTVWFSAFKVAFHVQIRAENLNFILTELVKN